MRYSKPIALLLVFAVSFLFLPSLFSVSAQQLQYPPSIEKGVTPDLHSYTQSVFIELLSAVSCQLSGIDPVNINGRCLGVDNKTGILGYTSGKGVVGFLNNSMAQMYDIPVSSSDYFSDLASNFGIAKKAQAQEGAGFASLKPFQELWKTFRNVVYVLFILLFLFIGLGIMFRIKMDPRSVMTIQNQLPKIVIGLILVTFSYAIAGFMIDMMNVTMYFSYGIVSQASPGGIVKNLTPADIQGTNPFGIAGKLTDSPFGLAGIVSEVTGSAVGAIKDAAGLGAANAPNIPNESITNIPGVESFFSGLVGIIPGIDKLGDIAGKIPGIGYFFGLLNKVGAATGVTRQYSYISYFIHLVSVGAGIYGGIHAGEIIDGICVGLTGGLSALGFGGTAGFNFCPGPTVSVPVAYITGVSIALLTEMVLREFIPNLLGFFLVLSITITALLRLWYQLLKAYILVLLGVIFAPLWIALGLIPGAQSVGFVPWIRNLAANLSVFPVVYTMFLIAKLLIEGVTKASRDVFLPPFVGGQNASEFGAVFALGILLLTPMVLEIVRDFLKVSRFKYGSAINSAMAAGQQMVAAPIKGTAGKIWGVDPYTKEAKLLTRKALNVTSRLPGRLGGAASLFAGESRGQRYERESKVKDTLKTKLASTTDPGEKAKIQNRINNMKWFNKEEEERIAEAKKDEENKIRIQAAGARAAATPPPAPAPGGGGGGTGGPDDDSETEGPADNGGEGEDGGGED